MPGDNLFPFYCILKANCASKVATLSPTTATESATACICNNGFTPSGKATTPATTCTCNTAAGLAVVTPTGTTNSYCCPANATVNAGVCVCNSTSASVYLFSYSNNWMCVTTCTTALNASLSGTKGINTESCVCNNGFVGAIKNTNGVLSMACTCPTGWTSSNITYKAAAINICCPPNSTAVAANNEC